MVRRKLVLRTTYGVYSYPSQFHSFTKMSNRNAITVIYFKLKHKYAVLFTNNINNFNLSSEARSYILA